MRRPLTTIVALALLAGLIWPPAPLAACTAPPGGLPQTTPLERAELATLVLSGVVTGLSDQPSGVPGETATIRVGSYLKGEGPAVIIVGGFGPSSFCRAPVQVGDERIFYVREGEAGAYIASYLSQFDATDPVSPEVLSQLEAALGPARPPSAGPAADGAQPGPAPWPGPLTYAGLGLIALAIAMTIISRRRPPNPE